MQTVHLDSAMVPAALRGAYQGKKFKAVICETVTVPATAGLWDSGARDTYTAIEFETGRTVDVSDNRSAPWDGRRDNTVTLRAGFCVVMHSTFLGKDSGLTFFIHPANAAALLPAPRAELAPHDRVVLAATKMYKASYGGKDRYDMARDDVEYNAEKKAAFPTRADWEAAKARLIQAGLLNKAGAITVAGRNAL